MSLLDSLIYFYNNITPFQTAISLSIIFLYFLYLFLRDLDVPPGPKGSPFFGYWPCLSAEAGHLQLKELTKKYGDVFSFRATGRLFIHLGSIKAIREAHIKKSEYFEGRLTAYSLLSSVFGGGVGFLNGEPWKVLRKFFVLKFKELGMINAKEDATGLIYDTLKDAMEELHNSKGRPIKISELAEIKSMLLIRRIIFNDQGISVDELRELSELYGIVSSSFTSANFLVTGSFAKFFIFPLTRNNWKVKSSARQIDSLLAKLVDRHKSEYEETHVSNLVECYFKEREDRRKKGDPTAAYFTDACLISSLNQFMQDGGLSVGVAIGELLSTLVKHPDEQEKIYKEILDVVGTQRLPTLDDKTKLPYTNAFIYEVLRFTDFFPLFPGLECSKETTIQGYKIPEGSISVLNLYAAHRNPETYENPEEFNPSRFLSTPDKQRADLPILFGVGKRSCIGEAYSMMQFFLYVTTIVQNFHLTFPKGKQGFETGLWSPERVEICAHPRSHAKTS